MINRLIPVFTRSEIAAVKEDEIVYAENQGRLVTIYTTSRKYSYYGKLSDLKEMLGHSFCSCHSSMIINFEKVASIKDGTFRMEGGQILPMGKNSYHSARKSFIDFVKNHNAQAENG